MSRVPLEWKGLDAGVLSVAGVWQDAGGRIGVPYRLPDGSLHNTKLFDGNGRTWWQTRDLPVLPLGLELLPDERWQRLVWLAEGESDALCLRQHFAEWRGQSVDVLGIPGAGTWKPEWAQYVEGFDSVLVFPDADEAGERMAAAITASVPSAAVVRLPDGEDVRSVVQRDGPDALAPHILGAEDAITPQLDRGISAVTWEEFAAVDESGAGAIVGAEGDEAVIPENGDVMFYGDGGAGKTTLTLDLACHLAAGDDWLGWTITRPWRVLVIENEGPRPLMRKKLRRKLAAWRGSPTGARLHVVDRPWAASRFDHTDTRQELASLIREREIDVVIVGPLSASGMTGAGTLAEVREFMALVALVRELSERAVAIILIHHENKGGAVSGAWEGSGDTLFHVTGMGHGRTRLYVHKARWASSAHASTLSLTWTDGEGFAVETKDETTDEDVAERLLAAISDNPGTSWTRVEEATPGVQAQRRRQIRDRLFADREIVNIAKIDGADRWLWECPPNKRSNLYPADDPTIQHLRPDRDAAGTRSASATGVTPSADTASRVPPYRDAGSRDADPPPAQRPLDPDDARWPE
jgi:hypothetical protein